MLGLVVQFFLYGWIQKKHPLEDKFNDNFCAQRDLTVKIKVMQKYLMGNPLCKMG
jgi:hypothetical protein